MTTAAGYALVTPARNEHANLERLASCVLAQELEPAAWIIVDDASDDGTAELARSLAEAHPWVRVVSTGADGNGLAAGRRQGRALDSFRRGVEALPGPIEVVVKVDADTSFDGAYFRSIVERFAAEPDLGIAGGACYEEEGGEWVRQKVIASHPRGASRAYRWPLIADVMALESRMGWDGLDEVKARMRGYRSAVLLDLAFKHHRPTGARERGRARHFAAQGRAAWYMGYRPSYLFLRTAYRARREPAAVGMLWGFAAAAAARDPRCPEPEVIRHLRGEQSVRAVLRHGAPP